MMFKVNQNILESVLDQVLKLNNQPNQDVSSKNITDSVCSIIKIILPNRPLEHSNDLNLEESFSILYKEIKKVVGHDLELDIDTILNKLLEKIPAFRKNTIADIESSYQGDPAASSKLEVEISYPGVFSVAVHRIANFLYANNIPIIPRIISEWSHSKTGIDIHPGATIGEGLFIDHGTGVVIGETCKIGDRVKIYQGVTLGAKSFPTDENGSVIKGLKRHPSVEDDVVIYANATILGGDTIIKKGSIIGGNTFLVKSN